MILDKLDKISYDYVWSINKCYLNKKLPNIDTYFASKYITDDLSLIKNKEFTNFIKNINNIIFCENMFINVLFDPLNDRYSKLHNFSLIYQIQDIIKKENTFWSFYRLNSILGCGVRMITSAIYSGAKNIYVAGIDGYNIDGSNDHSFEKNEANFELLKSLNTNPKINPKEVYGHMEIQYFWYCKYIKALQKEFNFNFINLAEDYPKISQFGRITKEYK